MTDELLTQYLLGSLPEEESEPLDELSIVDVGFARRLNQAEHDLVDAYVSCGLSGETLTRFQSTYLVTPEKLEKVRFAQALVLISNPRVAAQPAIRPWFFVMPSLRTRWLAAAAACLALAAAGYLIQRQHPLQSPPDIAQSVRGLPSVGQPDAAKPRDADAQTPPRAPGAFAVMLFAETRGATQIVAITPPLDAERVDFQLQLEFDDFPNYRAALRDPATNAIAWQSTQLTPVSLAGRRTVIAGVPAALLKLQNYTLELAGISSAGAAETVASYPFRVVAK